MDGLWLAACRLERMERSDEQCVLLRGVGNVLFGGVVGHREVLEQAGHLKARQLTHSQHFADGGIKIGAQGKADAAHAGICLEVDLYSAACLYGSSGKVLRLFGGVARYGDILVDEGLGVLRLNMAQNKDGQSLPVLTQLHGLGQAAHCQPCCTLLRKNAGTLHSAVAIAVGLDHRAQRQVTGPGFDGPEVMPQGIEVDLGPDVFFKRLFLHDLFPFLVR